MTRNMNRMIQLAMTRIGRSEKQPMPMVGMMGAGGAAKQLIRSTKSNEA